ncbi:MAG: acyl carrier protein [Candidatus Omnitrophota bacterium]
MGSTVNEANISGRVINAVDAMMKTFNRSVSFKLSGETNIYTDLGIDSVELMDLLGFIEREFAITIDAEKVVGSKTINDITEFVSSVLKNKGK